MNLCSLSLKTESNGINKFFVFFFLFWFSWSCRGKSFSRIIQAVGRIQLHVTVELVPVSWLALVLESFWVPRIHLHTWLVAIFKGRDGGSGSSHTSLGPLPFILISQASSSYSSTSDGLFCLLLLRVDVITLVPLIIQNNLPILMSADKYPWFHQQSTF